MISIPDFIKRDSLIGVTAPSDGIQDVMKYKKIEAAQKKLGRLGFSIKCTKDCRESYKGRSGTAQKRASEFMELLEDKDVEAVILARGGDYLLEILPYIDFEKIKKDKRCQKWIQGYSDPTGLLYSITVNSELATIYGNNFTVFGQRKYDDSIYANLNLLTGGEEYLRFPSKSHGTFAKTENNIGHIFVQHSYDKCSDSYPKSNAVFSEFSINKDNFTKVWDYGKNRVSGKMHSSCNMHGMLLGGCLDVLSMLAGTKYDNTAGFIKRSAEDGVIWYFESFELSSEQLTLALWQLREAGWFENAKGFIFGRPAFYHSGYGIEYADAAMAALSVLKCPVAFDADISHYPPRMSIVNGAKADFNIKHGMAELKMYL